jgi:hypothetical protein
MLRSLLSHFRAFLGDADHDKHHYKWDPARYFLFRLLLLTMGLHDSYNGKTVSLLPRFKTIIAEQRNSGIIPPTYEFIKRTLERCCRRPSFQKAAPIAALQDITNKRKRHSFGRKSQCTNESSQLASILGDNANVLGQLMIEDIRNFGNDTIDEPIVVVASSKHPLFANPPRKLQSMATQDNYPVHIVCEEDAFIQLPSRLLRNDLALYDNDLKDLLSSCT